MSYGNPEYLRPTYFIDSDSEPISNFAKTFTDQSASEFEKAIQLFYAVRDEIRYDPYDVKPIRRTLKASSVILKGSGFCVAKAIVLAALARNQNIPARLGFADVTNHLSTARLRNLMKSNLFVYHGYTELWLGKRWVKATPAFNLSLCTKFRVKPLEFDGLHDSVFHEYDTQGNRHMEYVVDHGHFPDLPYEQIFRAYEIQYPDMFEKLRNTENFDFSQEAAEEN